MATSSDISPVVGRLVELTPDAEADISRLLAQLTDEASADSARISEMLALPHCHLLVARAGARIVGMASVCIYTIPTGRRAWIEDVVVDARWRGRGIATRLVERAIDQARRVSPCTVMLTSRPSRVAANRLYRHMGFGSKETNVYKIEV